MKGTRSRRSTRAAWRPRAQVWLLAALLLAAQAFGLAHRVAHAPGLSGAFHADSPGLSGAFHADSPGLSGAFHADSPGLPDLTHFSAAFAPGAHDCDHPHHHGLATPLSGHEAGSAECRLIDQLAHADALFGSPELPLLLAPQATVLVAAAVPARPQGDAAAYLARAPPQAGHGAAPSA
jgi:hypothetical protein